MKELTINTSHSSYSIYIEANILMSISNYLDTKRRYLIIRDEHIPDDLLATITQALPKAVVYTSISGEEAKSLANYEKILQFMLDHQFSRKDAVIALGGGVIGDLSGFVAATYMRGIDFINIPTTTLSQIDSSIGGKVAVNLNKTKNIVGAFYPPKLVLIDTNTLASLPERHFYNGLAEALKAGIIYRPQLVSLLAQQDPYKIIEEIIYQSLLVKKAIVEEDEFEQNVRKLLNFGHTIGHGIESYYELKDVLHGEAVAIGMWAVIDDETIKKQLKPIYEKLHLPMTKQFDIEAVYQFILQDKKATSDHISFIKLKKIGEAYIEEVPLDEIHKRLEDLTWAVS